MSVAELRGLCWLIAIFFWGMALVYLVRIFPLLKSRDRDDLIRYYQGKCQSYWSFLRGAIIMLPFDVLDARENPENFWGVALTFIVSVFIAIRWRSDRRAGQRLIDEADQDSECTVTNPPH